MKTESKVPIATKDQFPSFSFLLISLYLVATVVLTVTNLAFAEAATDQKIEYYLAKKDWDSLVKIGQPAVPRLIAALSDNDESVLMGSIDTLGRIGDRTAIEPLVAVLKGNALMAEDAAAALVKLGYAPESLDDKVALYVASNRMKDLVKIGPLATAPLCRLLREFKAKGDAASYKDAALIARALGEIGNRDAVNTLIAVADGNDRVGSGYTNVAPHYPLTKAAVEALGKTRDPNAVEPLINKLLDLKTCGEIWEACAKALTELGDHRAVAPLGKLLIRHWNRWQYDTDYRPAVCDALVKFGAISVEPLITALKNDDAETRKLAVEALGKIGDKRAVQPLCELLKDEKPEVRRAVVNALGQLKDKKAIDPLIGALKDTDSGVRADAAKALDELGWKP